MNPDLEKLVRLHHAEAELKHVQLELAEIPRLPRKDIEDRLGQEPAGTSTPPGRRSRPRRRPASRTRPRCRTSRRSRSKYKGQLMEVKTNKEYTAVLHEIEGVERDIKAPRGQVILEEMEKAEAPRPGGEARARPTSRGTRRTPGRRDGRSSTPAPRGSGRRRRSSRGSATSWRPLVPGRRPHPLHARREAAGRRGRGGAGRHVPGLPREDAGADLGRGSKKNETSCSSASCAAAVLLLRAAAADRRRPEP